MKTYSLRAKDISKKWIVIDAKNACVGRLAAFVSTRLKGKHKPEYTPHMDCGDNVILVNVDQVALTGKKLTDKIYYRHTGYFGGLKTTTPNKILEGKFPERVMLLAIKRMLGKGPLSRQRMRNIRLYKGAEHDQAAQSPTVIDFASLNRKNRRN